MNREAPQRVDQPTTKTVEETLARLNKTTQLSPASIESAEKIEEQAEELEKPTKLPPGFMDKEFVI
jgi:hypothetical protein